MIGRIFISLALLASVSTACLAEELAGTLKKIRDTGYVTIGYRESSIPFSYLDDQQKPIGYAIDICLRVIQVIKDDLKFDNIDIRYNPVTSSTRIPLIANGTVDLECGSTNNTTERQKQVAFSNTYYLTASKFVSTVQTKALTISDLKGKTVASTSGTVNIRQLNEVNSVRQLGITVLAAKDHAEAFLMVETGRAAAFVMDDILLASLVASSKEPAAYVISEEGLSLPEPYAIMMRRDDPQFKRLVDRATAELYSSPDMLKLYDIWFKHSIPPRGVNLMVPLAPPLMGAFNKPTDSADPASYSR